MCPRRCAGLMNRLLIKQSEECTRTHDASAGIFTEIQQPVIAGDEVFGLTKPHGGEHGVVFRIASDWNHILWKDRNRLGSRAEKQLKPVRIRGVDVITSGNSRKSQLGAGMLDDVFRHDQFEALRLPRLKSMPRRTQWTDHG